MTDTPTPTDQPSELDAIRARMDARKIWMIVWNPSESRYYLQHLEPQCGDFFTTEQEANNYFKAHELTAEYHVVGYVPDTDSRCLLELLDERDGLLAELNNSYGEVLGHCGTLERELAEANPVKYEQVPNGCWVACIAGITGLPHEVLSSFVPQEENGWLDSDYHNNVNSYLRAHGWRLCYMGYDIPAGFGIGTGISPRGNSHAVIVLDGKLWHDPHPSQSGVDKLSTFEVLIPTLGIADSSDAERLLSHISE